MQVPQHFIISVLGADEKVTPCANSATVPVAQPAALTEANPVKEAAEPEQATPAETDAAKPTLAELPYPDHLGALREAEQKADETSANSDSAAAPSKPAAAPAATTTGEVLSCPHSSVRALFVLEGVRRLGWPVCCSLSWTSSCNVLHACVKGCR